MTFSLRYSFLLFSQIFLLMADLIFNALTEFARTRPRLQLVLFIFQDGLIIISLMVMIVSFFSTYVFQAGLVEVLFDRFRVTILISICYLLFTLSLHIWLMTERWNEPLKHMWSTSLTIYFIFHRFIAPIYYYSTKRAILRIADPRFYESMPWISEQIMQS